MNFAKDFRKYLQSKFSGKVSVFDSILRQGVLTPYIVKEGKDNMIQSDVFSELMAKRIIFFGEDVNTDTSGIALCQLLYMHSVDSSAPISMYIASPGGEVYTGLALYDTMQLVQQDLELSTVCCGLAASMGSILLSGGSPGKRMALPHSRVMIHSVSTGTGRITYPDLVVQTRETGYLNEELMQILATKSGKSLDEVTADCGRDCWLKAEECLPGKYGPLGLIDKIIDSL